MTADPCPHCHGPLWPSTEATADDLAATYCPRCDVTTHRLGI